MGLSIFDHDLNFGDVGGAVGSYIGGSGLNVGGSVAGQVISAREVTVEVVGAVVGWSSFLLPMYGVYQVATAAGKVKAILEREGWKIVGDPIEAGFVAGYGQRFLVRALVNSQYSDADVLHNMKVQLSSLLTVASVKIVEKKAPVNVDGSQSSYSPGGSGVLSSFALGMGVSTPILIAGGAVLLLVLLKR